MTSEDGGAPLVTLEPDDQAAAVAAVKSFARIASGDDDAVIADAVDAAVGLAERFTGQLLICRTVTVSIAASRDWRRLPVSPVAAIAEVVGFGGDGVAVDWPSGAYAIDIDASGDGYVRVLVPGAVVRLAVTASAGMAADWASLPAVLRQGVVMLATHLLDARDAGAAPPAAVSALWRPFRRIAIGGECRI